MSGKLVGSNTNDGNKAIAFDVVDTTKAYVYLMPNVNKFQELLGNQTHTLITASANIGTEWKTNPNGIINEIEVVEVYGDSQNTKQSKQTSNNSTIIKRTKTPEVYIDSYIGTLQSEGQYLIVFDEELNPTKYLNGSQQVFIITDIISTDSTPPETTGLLDSKKVTELSLVDIDTYRDNYIHASIQFNLDDSLNKGEINELKLDIQSQSPINSIEVIGEQDGLKEAITIKTKENLTPLMMNCVGDEDKLSMYSPWIDHDFSLPFLWAKAFTAKDKLEAVIQRTEAQELILDLLMFAYGFAVKWNFVAYVTEGNDAGKIKGDQYVGYVPYQVSAIAGQDPKKLIDGRYEKYLRDFPQLESSDEIRQINEFVVALSRYIEATKAVAGGNNLFNKALYPYILRPFGSLLPTTEKAVNPIPGNNNEINTFVFSKDTEFTLESEYFNIITDDLTNKTEINLNTERTIQLDRKIFLPKLENTIVEKDLSVYPGDKDTSSNKDLEYLFYIHIDPNKIKDLFAAKETIDLSTPKGSEVKVSESTFGDYGKEYSSASELFKDLGYKGQFKSGTLEPVFTKKQLSARIQQDSGVGTNIERFISGDLQKAFEFYIGYSEQKVIQELGYDPKSIRNWINSDANKVGTFTATASFEVKHYRIKDLVYISSGSNVKIPALDRKAIYDKYEFRTLIDALSVDPTNPQSKYTLQVDFDKSLQRVNEIIIRSIWGEEITLHIGGITKTFPLFNKNDESVATERIKLL